MHLIEKMESNNQHSDHELVLRALQSKNALIDIVRRYQAPLRRYIARLGCRDPHDQEDILQEIFLKVYVNLNEVDAHLKFSSWIYRIAHNEAISFFRKKKVRPQLFASQEEWPWIENIADDLDLAENYNKACDAQIIRKALAELDRHYRDVLVLKYMEEKSYNEISDILKIPVGTVGTLVNRGKKQLKKMLEAKNLSL